MAKFERRWKGFDTFDTPKGALYFSEKNDVSTNNIHNVSEINHNPTVSNPRASISKKYKGVYGVSKVSKPQIEVLSSCQCEVLERLKTGPTCQHCGFRIWCATCQGCRSCYVEQMLKENHD